MQTPEFKKELIKAKNQKGKSASLSSAAASSTSKSRSSKRDRSDDTSSGNTNNLSKRSRQEKKPDNYPKAALSAYILFGNDQRGKITKQYPTLKITEVSKKIGEMWKNSA
uniref:Non-histone chromosomal protein 6 n=1 Tax=Lygus hesperus TaxID=30085 RepID=A0A0A9YRG4_LYGHE